MMATAPVSLALNAEELAAVTFIDFLDRAGINAITVGPVAGSVTAPGGRARATSREAGLSLMALVKKSAADWLTCRWKISRS